MYRYLNIIYISNMSQLKYEFLLVKRLTKSYKHNTILYLYQLTLVLVGYIN